MAACGSLDTKLRTRYANEYNCPFGETTFHELGGGAVRVSGCGGAVSYVCMRDATGLRACSEENRDFPEPAREVAGDALSQPASAPQATTTTGVSQRTDSDGNIELTGTSKLDGAELWLFAKPRANKEQVRVMIRVAPLVQQARAQCNLELMVNGEKRDLGKLELDAADGREDLSAYLSLTSVAELADASRVAGRVCDVRFMLEGEDRAVVREFVTRFNEELAWDAPAANSAPSQVPASSAAAASPAGN